MHPLRLSEVVLSPKRRGTRWLPLALTLHLYMAGRSLARLQIYSGIQLNTTFGSGYGLG